MSYLRPSFLLLLNRTFRGSELLPSGLVTSRHCSMACQSCAGLEDAPSVTLAELKVRWQLSTRHYKVFTGGILIRCYESEVTGQFPTTPFSLSDLSLIGEARAPSQVLRLVLCLIIFFW
eukprot:EG_transcript_35290